MKLPGDRTSVGFGAPAVRALGLGSILALAGLGGAMESYYRFRVAPDLENPAARTAGSEMLDQVLGSAVEGDPVQIAADGLGASEVDGPVWDLPNLDHPRVDYWVERFTTDKRGEFSRFLERSGRYVPMISEKLEERGMPQDLIYLAMIESGFNPRAYSHAHASGLWQFISETGRRYGLDINLAVDERNDPIRSTEAALDYLTYLHRRFGSWYLAAAGYNTGENRVGRIMRQVTGSERGSEESYYRIWNRLPRETRDYVPLMVAAARIAKEPQRYGFDSVEIAEPMRFDEVSVPAATPLPAIAQAAGTSVEAIRELNPHFKLNRTRNDRASEVRIPPGSGTMFAANWDRVRANTQFASAPAATPSETRYRVRRGDNLTRIARRHGVSINAIRRANGLRGDFIRAGSVLTIPA